MYSTNNTDDKRFKCYNRYDTMELLILGTYFHSKNGENKEFSTVLLSGEKERILSPRRQ
jgi:hypothetical protein